MAPSKNKSNTGRDSRPDATAGDGLQEFGSQGTEALFAMYADRMMRGEVLDLEIIKQDHPEFGEQLTSQLRSFQELAQPSDDLSSRTIGEYNLVRQIGRGGMGVVYEGWQKNLERRVAIKVLPTGITADARSIVRFTQEAQLAARLNHPNIVTVYGMGVENDVPYFVMEYVEGQTLAEFVAELRQEWGTQIIQDKSTDSSGDRQPLDLEYCLRIAKAFSGVADGLQHAHDEGIIHRDIKPSNLIVESVPDEEKRETKQLRLLDFGLARFEGNETFTRTGDVLGTLLYMSPEQVVAGKSSKVDSRTDIFSLGVTLYEALTLRTPFHGENQQDTVSQIINCQPLPPRKINSRIPIDLETIILKCISKSPGERYATSRELAQELRRFAKGDPILARPLPALEKIRRVAWRHRGKVATSLTLIVLACVATWFGWRSSVAEKAIREAKYDPLVEEACLEMRKLTNWFITDQRPHELSIYPWGRFVGTEYYRPTSTSETLQPIEAAESLFGNAIKVCPDRADAYWHRARTRLILGDEVGARKDLIRATDLNPELVPALFLKASVLRSLSNQPAILTANELGQPEELKKRAAETENLARNVAKNGNWQSHWLAGQRFAEQAKYQKAINEFELSLDRIKEHQQSNGGREPFVGARKEILFLISVCCRRGALYDEGIEQIAIVCHEWPDALQAQLLQGLMRLMSGNHSGASAKFEQVYKASNDKESVAFYVVAYYLGNIIRQWNTSNRQQVNETFLAHWMDRISDEARKHWLLSQKDEMEGAKVTAKHLLDAIEDAPDIAEYYLWLAKEKWEWESPGKIAEDLRKAKSRPALSKHPQINAFLAFFLLKQANVTAEDRALAEACCEIATANIEPRAKEVKVFLAMAMGKLEEWKTAPDFAEAIKLLEEVTVRDIGYIQEMRGHFFSDAAKCARVKGLSTWRGLCDRALEEYGICTRRWPGVSRFPFEERTRWYLNLEKFDEAIAELQSGLDAGKYQADDMKVEFAKFAFEKALQVYQVDNDRPDANELLIELLTSRPKLDLGAYPEQWAAALEAQLEHESDAKRRQSVVSRLRDVFRYLGAEEKLKSIEAELEGNQDNQVTRNGGGK